MPNVKRLAVAAVVATLTIGVPAVYADTPTEANFASCNAEARAGVQSGSAVPTLKDHTRAETARRVQAAGGQSAVTDPRDPQLVGMSPQGAADAAYHAGYRTCMRRSGF